MPPQFRPDRCETCRWWKRHTARETIGVCHRYPPVCVEAIVSLDARLIDADYGTATFAESSFPWVRPVTQFDDFCGEWKTTDSGITLGPPALR